MFAVISEGEFVVESETIYCKTSYHEKKALTLSFIPKRVFHTTNYSHHKEERFIA